MSKPNEAETQRTLAALKESETSRRNAESLLEETRKAAGETRERLVEAEEECSASHAERDHACANLKALQYSLITVKDAARHSQQIPKEGANTSMKDGVAASTEQNQGQHNQSQDNKASCLYPDKDRITSSSETAFSSGGAHGTFSSAATCIHGRPSTGACRGSDVTTSLRTPAERIGFGTTTTTTAASSSACGASGDLVRAKTAPIISPTPELLSAGARNFCPESTPSPFVPLPPFGRRRSWSTPTECSTSSDNATGSFDRSVESAAGFSSVAAGRAFEFGGTRDGVDSTRSQEVVLVAGKPMIGGVTGLPSPVVLAAAATSSTPTTTTTTRQQQQQPQQRWTCRQGGSSEMVMSQPLSSSSGGPCPGQREAFLGLPKTGSGLANSQQSSTTKNVGPALEVFGDGVVDVAAGAGTLGSRVARGGSATVTGMAASGAGWVAQLAQLVQLGKRAGGAVVDAVPEDVTRWVNVLNGGHTVVLLDVEAMGFFHSEDRVIQLAAKVKGREDPNHSFSAFVNPMRRLIPYRIQANNAKPFREAPKGRMGGVVVVAHNAGFDH